MSICKPKYLPPLIKVIQIKTEQGIAATSQATMTPTGQTDFQPDINDWQQGTETEIDYL